MKQQKKQNQTKSATDLAGSQDDLIALKAEKQRLNYKAPRLNKKIRKLQTELSSLDGQGATKGGLSAEAKQQKIAELEKSLKQVQNERAELDSAREQISAKIQSADPTSTSIKPKAKADTNKTKAVKSGQSTGKVTDVDSKRLIPQYQRNHEKLAQLMAEKTDLDRSIKAVHEKIRNRQQRQKLLEEKSLKELGLTEEAKIQNQVDLKVEEKNLAIERDESIAVREKLKSEMVKLTKTLKGIEAKLGYKPDVETNLDQTKVDSAKSDKTQSSVSAQATEAIERETDSDGSDTGSIKPSEEVEQSIAELNLKQAELEKIRSEVRTFTINIKGLNAKIRRVENNITKLESQSPADSGLSATEKSKNLSELKFNLQRLQKEHEESESGRAKLKPKVDELVIAIKAIENDVPVSIIESQANIKAGSEGIGETKLTEVSKRDNELYELTPNKAIFTPESNPYTGLRRLRKYFGSIEEISKMPNLIEVQRDSYAKFLQIDLTNLDSIGISDSSFKEFSKKDQPKTSSGSSKIKNLESKIKKIEKARDAQLIVKSNLISEISSLEESGKIHDLVEQLKKGEKDCRGKSLMNVNLDGLDLSGVDFSGSDLSGASFKRTNLEDAILGEKDSIYSDTTFRDANFEGARMVNAKLGGKNGDFQNANFKNCNLTHAVLEGDTESYADENGNILFRGEADFSGSNFEGAEFWGAAFSGAFFMNCNFRSVDLRNAIIAAVSFSRADLSYADLREQKLDLAVFESAELVGTKLKNANLNNVELYNANLAEANLNGASLEGSKLENANLENARLLKADLRSAELVRANLEGADMEGANLSNAMLDDANIRNLNLNEAILDGANIKGAHTNGPNNKTVEKVTNKYVEPAAKKKLKASDFKRIKQVLKQKRELLQNCEKLLNELSNELGEYLREIGLLLPEENQENASVQVVKEGHSEAKLDTVFKSIFPITNHTETATLEYISYTVEKPKFEVEECRQRGMTYSLPLKVTLRLIVFDVDEDTKSRTVKDIKEQEVYMGELPLMTNTGTFIVNGSERVIVSQMHRSPGVFFDHDKGKSHSSGRLLFAGRVIPYRGSWLDIEFDAKDIVYARIDRKRKFPVTTLLMALGLDAEQILSTFYDTVSYTKSRNQWRVKFDPNRFVGTTVTDDIVDAKTKKIVLEAGKRFTRRHANQFKEQGIKDILVNSDSLIGSFIAEDIANLETGEIIAEIGAELTESLIQEAEELGYKDLTVLDIDYVNVGPYILNTLAVDKNIDRETALKDIYRVLRPGDPPTLDIAEELFEKLFFSEERYDLSSVGRVKMNMRLDLDCDPDVKILRKEDIIGLIQQLLLLRDGKGEIDDIDNLGNRRVRSVGELMENQYRIGLTRLERATKEKMSSADIATAMPQDLINAKPAVSAMREFFGSSQLSQFMDQTNPLSEITHKRRLSALGPGGLTRERAGFEVRDVHTTHYGRICPIETPEGQNIGLINSLATFARINEYGFIESPYRKIVNGAVTNEIEYLSAIEEAKYHIAPSDEKVENGKLASDLVSCRFAGEPTMIPRERIEYMDVSPKQVVSVAASLIPFLENDDAHRALMGSNMQRQAVPLVQSEAPFVGTGMEREVARDSGAAIVAGRTGNVMQVDANRIVVSVTEDYDPSKRGVDIYRLRKYQRSNQNTCVNQRPIVKVGDHVMKGDIIADGPSTDLGELALGRNVLVAFMPWNGYNFEDSILLSERIVHEDVFTSIHIEEFEVSARDTKLGPEEITRDIPNVSEEMLRNLDEAGMIYVGAEVKANDILVGKVTPKGEEVITPEEKLLRAIFGEKASEVSDTSLRVPVGVTGTVVEVRVFNRHGVEKDERALSNEREEIERIFKDHEDERKILNQNVYDRVKAQILGKKATRGPQGYKKNTEITEEFLADCLQTEWWQFVFSDNKMMSELEAMRKLYDENVKELKASFEEKRDKIQSGDELMPSVMKMVKVFVAVKRKLQPGDKMAGRHGNKGVVSKINPIEDMPFLEDGTPVDIVLNPLGVPSRMNVGQILETHLGMASVGLGRQIAEMYEEYQRNGKIEKLRNKIAEIYGENKKGESIQDIDDKGLITLSRQLKKGVPIATPVFDGAKESDVSDLLEENKFDRSGQMTVFDGRTGEPFERKVTVGYKYILKLHHLVDEKIHARSVGPYSLVTQQPLGGKAQFGGQRFGEMEVWALEAYGAAYTLQEILTIKSDDVAGRTKLYESIVKGDDTFVAGIPESFNVLVKEIQSLGLNLEMRDSNFFEYHDDDGDLIEEVTE